MSGIPLALIFGVLAFLAWRRGWRGGALMVWAVLFGVFLGGSARTAVVNFTEHVAAAVESGTSSAAEDVRR